MRAGAALVGQMRVDFASSLRLGGHDLTVIRPSRAKNLSQPAVARWWRYALAARRAAQDRRPRNLKMSAADLRCLDVYYTSPRPVYVVTVPHGDSFNLFPVDLVSFLGDAGFFLALRSSSPSIPFMQEDGRLVFSSVPAALRDTIYRLGAHHTRAYDRVDDLGLALTPSPAFGLPAPAQAFRVREFRVLDHRTVGSHVVFQAVQVAISERDLEPQLAHVSAAFARYAARLGAPFVAAG
ncbi:MAG: flavin reductase [Acidobacteria bacterium]|nr:flavin reductase [Acidobacteriota bacterium]